MPKYSSKKAVVVIKSFWNSVLTLDPIFVVGCFVGGISMAMWLKPMLIMGFGGELFKKGESSC